MVMDDGWSAPRDVYQRGPFGAEVAGGPKKVVEEQLQPQRLVTKKLVETVILSVLVFTVAMLPMVLSYVQPPESVLQMKELIAEWCTPSICFVFLVVGIMVATSGVLSNGGAAPSGSLHERGDAAAYQRHMTTVVQQEALRMPDIFSVGEGMRPLSIPIPAPVPFPGCDFPAVRPLPFYLKREMSSRFESDDVRGLGKSSASAPSLQFEHLTAAKISATQSLDHESDFPQSHEPVMSNSNSSFQDPFMSNSNSFHEHLAARGTSVSTPRFDHDYPTVPASASVTTSVQHGVPASPAPACTSGRSFKGTQSPVLTSTHVIDHSPPASSPTMSHGDAATAPSPGPTPAPFFVQEISSTSNTYTPSPIQPSTPAPHTHPPASPVTVREVVVPPPPHQALPSVTDSTVDDGAGSAIPEFLADSPTATRTAAPPPPASPHATSIASVPSPTPLPSRSPRTSLDATVITPVEVHLSPIVTRKPRRSTSSKTGSSSGAFRESSGRKPPSHPVFHHTGGTMSVPAKRSTSAAQKHEGELYLAMKAAVPQSQKRTFGAPPQEATKERPSAMGSKSVAGSAVEDTNLKPADDDVDQRVEAFLANFRQQMRLQRQESLLRQRRGEE